MHTFVDIYNRRCYEYPSRINLSIQGDIENHKNDNRSENYNNDDYDNDEDNDSNDDGSIILVCPAFFHN